MMMIITDRQCLYQSTHKSYTYIMRLIRLASLVRVDCTQKAVFIKLQRVLILCFANSILIILVILYRLSAMNSFKSSPLIQDKPFKQHTRKARKISKKTLSKEQQLIVANPFKHADEQNILPSHLKSQLQHIDYISPAHIHNITFTTAANARRSSTFAKHLQTMQNAAKKQAENYQFFMGCKVDKKQSCQTEIMQQEQPISIEQNENLSLKMNQCFLMMDADHMQRQPITFFEQQQQEDDMLFYSQNIIQYDDGGEEYEAYFDV